MYLKNHYRRRVTYCILSCVMIGLYLPGKAQTDTVFWFVAPEVAASHGDEPLFMGISSVGLPTTATITQPANPHFEPIIVELDTLDIQEIVLTHLKTSIENDSSAQALNKGIQITSKQPIRAYYRVGSGRNQDIFTLKGEQALGTEFIVPSQYHFPNRHGRSAADIVATSDGTFVTIETQQQLIGHEDQTKFHVKLQKGQTYSLRAASAKPDGKVGGTGITSNKPIAVTDSDDSIINQNGRGWDLIGDQLVPVHVLGTEYIVARGEGDTERAYLWATRDGTVIRSGDSTYYLDRAESAFMDIGDPASYLSSNHPIYVWHLTGIGKEVGGGLIPPIGCTGNNQLHFVRNAGKLFRLILLTQRSAVEGFVLDGVSAFVKKEDFQAISPQSDWMVANLHLDQTLRRGLHFIENQKGHFHLGILSGTSSGVTYGYFSNYSNLNIAESYTFCEGDSITLSAGADLFDYKWSNGVKAPSITIDQPGDVWVELQMNGCRYRDTTTVKMTRLAPQLGKDTVVCGAKPVLIQAKAYPNATYRWQDGHTESTFEATESGTYHITLSRPGCVVTGKDTIEVTQVVQHFDLGQDTALCPQNSIALEVKDSRGSLTWQDNSHDDTFWVNHPGTYWVEQNILGCKHRDSITVKDAFIPFEFYQEESFCEGDTFSFDPNLSSATLNQLSWSDGYPFLDRIIDEGGDYTLIYEDQCGMQTGTLRTTLKDCSCQPFVPNIFTPNNDGINDTFQPEIPCEVNTYSLRVYDRWGHEVFSSQEVDYGWDGTAPSHNKVLDGVYFWFIEYETQRERGSIRAYQGNLTLLMND